MGRDTAHKVFLDGLLKHIARTHKVKGVSTWISSLLFLSL